MLLVTVSWPIAELRPPFRPPAEDEPLILAYLDDGSLMSTSAAKAQATHDLVAAEWERVGFALHDGKGHDACAEWEKVGVRISGLTGEVRPKVSRRWRLEMGTRGLLSRQECTAKELEIVVGHFTSMFLIRRPLLCVFK